MWVRVHVCAMSVRDHVCRVQLCVCVRECACLHVCDPVCVHARLFVHGVYTCICVCARVHSCVCPPVCRLSKVYMRASFYLLLYLSSHTNCFGT